MSGKIMLMIFHIILSLFFKAFQRNKRKGHILNVKKMGEFSLIKSYHMNLKYERLCLLLNLLVDYF